MEAYKKRRIKIQFADFWRNFDSQNNYFTRLLAQRYEVHVCDNPDFLIYSSFGKRHWNYSCHRIFYTGENRRPDFRFCDFAFSFDYLKHPKHYRLPLCARHSQYQTLTKSIQSPENILQQKSRFCNFVYSNKLCPKRNRFFDKLSKYKHVDSGGRWRNNIGQPVANKIEFLRNYKFTIAFENSSQPGYTTEKIVDPMVANSLPIYWGDPLVHLDFNPKSFINYFDYGSDDALIDRIIEVDNNDDLYLEYHRQPWLHNNEPDPRYSDQAVLNQFERIFDTRETQVALARNRLRYFDMGSSLWGGSRRLVDKTKRMFRSA